ncbi:cytosolic protein [Acidimicrobiaceae bacterium USS-CC1]|uniref:Cytosolic protein n=1 Tax=Acidiferrimicrobium australe TaxID=2664430 RepID=A0ABW9QPA0_9ACTN|nr:cytosolic protein [Acidiferrimicrobium australe]
MTEAVHPRPSDRARELVAGAVDLHVHVAPDVMRRRITDFDLARRHVDEGLGGFVLKSHYVPTAERAASVASAVPGAEVYGAITLNGSVGGINPVAVEIAAREGARIVWMPTVDSHNQRTCSASDPEGAKPPMWAQLQEELQERGIAAPPIPVVNGGGEVLPEVIDVLRIIARYDLILATGHLGRDEIMAVVRAANDEGVQRIIVTHPEFTSQRLSGADQRELAERGAFLERCFTTPYTGKVEWGEMLANIRTAGVANSFLSSDLGQPFNPPVEDGLALMAEHLMGAGFDLDEVRLMTVENTKKLVTPKAVA